MSVSAYESYRDSGVVGIGPVPSHWRLSALKRAVTPKRRITYGIVQGGPDLPEGVPYIRPTDMGEESGVANLAGLMKTSLEIAESYSRSSLLAGDLVCSIGPSFGKVMVVPASLAGANLTQGTARVAVNAEYVSKFVFWVLRSEPSHYQWECSIGGATFRALNLEPLSETQFCAPPLAEQTAIAAFLDRETAKIDALVEEQRRLVELLKEKRQAVISHAVTKGLDSTVPMKDSGVEWLGEVPAHWDVTAIKRLCLLITDGAHISPETEDGVYSFVSTKDLLADGIDFDGCLRTSASSYEYLVKAGCRPAVHDVLFSKDGTIGRTVVVRDDREFVVASSLIIIRPDGNQLDASYLDFLCQSDCVQHQVESFVKGAGLPRLSIQNLLRVLGVFPPLAEQSAIARSLLAVTGNFRELITEAERSITLLQERRAALISAAVTGKIDVRGLVPAEAEAA